MSKTKISEKEEEEEEGRLDNQVYWVAHLYGGGRIVYELDVSLENIMSSTLNNLISVQSKRKLSIPKMLFIYEVNYPEVGQSDGCCANRCVWLCCADAEKC